MTDGLRCPPTGSYDVAWVSAIGKEFLIASAMLDEVFGCPPDIPDGDTSAYVFGRVGHHNVVLASLPEKRVGVEQAGRLAENITRSFERLRFGLMVGIAGGAPTRTNDIRLGDVIVSTPNDSKRLGGVVHYLFGASIQDMGFQRRGSLNAPPELLLNAVSSLWLKRNQGLVDLDQLVTDTVASKSPDYDGYSRPNQDSDILFNATFLHPRGIKECAEVCQLVEEEQVTRQVRPREGRVAIHHGIVGSASNLMRDATLRDQIAEADGVMCFEMESAGLMNNRLGWLVVRGICDYCDTHKNDAWQNYAAATAAVYAKELLRAIRPRAGPKSAMATNTGMGGGRQDVLKLLHFEDMDTKRRLSMPEGTYNFDWIWTTTFNSWLTESNDSFWICGKPGSGKSTLMAYLASHKQTRGQLRSIIPNFHVIHFFYDYRAGSGLANNILGMLRRLLYQLAEEFASIKRRLQEQLDMDNLNVNDKQSLLDCACKALEGPDFRICAFVDGLDEYEGNYHHLLDIFQSLLERTEIKLCLASRPEVEISSRIRIFSQIKMQDHNVPSMQAYAEAKIRETDMSYVDVKSKVNGSLREKLAQKAEGIILWHKLVFDELIGMCEAGCSLEQIEDFVEEVPPGLKPLFERILAKVPASNRPEAALLLHCFQELENIPDEPHDSSPMTPDHLRGIYNIATEQLQRCVTLRVFTRHEDLQQGLKSLLRGLIEVYNLSFSEADLHDGLDALYGTSGQGIRYIHRTLSSFLRDTQWVSSNLPPAFYQLWPDWFLFRLTVSIIEEASADRVIEGNLLDQCMKEFIQLQPTSYHSTIQELAEDFAQSSMPVKHVLLRRQSYLLALMKELYPRFESASFARAKQLKLGKLRHRILKSALALCPPFSLAGRWSDRCTILRSSYCWVLHQARLYEQAKGSSYAILGPVLQSRQNLMLVMFSAGFLGVRKYNPFMSALERDSVQPELDLMLAIYFGLSGYFSDRIKDVRLSSQQSTTLTRTVIYQYSGRLYCYVGPTYEALMVSFLETIVPLSGGLDSESICSIFTWFKLCTPRVAGTARAILPFVQPLRSRPISNDHCPFCRHLDTGSNLLRDWMTSLCDPISCAYSQISGFRYDPGFYKDLLSLFLRTGLDINAPCYPKGTILHLLFDSTVDEFGLWIRPDAVRWRFLALIEAGADPTIPTSRGTAIDAAEKLRRNKKAMKSIDSEGLDIMIEFMHHFRQHGTWPEDRERLRVRFEFEDSEIDALQSHGLVAGRV